MENLILERQKMEEANRLRVAGLRRFGFAITLFNVLGHFYLGFEQSFAQPIVALATAYLMEIALEVVAAKNDGRPYKFAGGPVKFLDFILSAHITALAVSMLTYANDRLWVVCFATAIAIGSKAIFKAKIGKGTRHFMNPSNFGISLTLFAFPWVGIAPPYQFTENLATYGDWILPCIIICSGTILNYLFTKRVTLILAWLIGFALQAVLRHFIFDTPVVAALLPMTGVAFILYTFYMVTDPATTPSSRMGQIVFGAGNAFVYGLLMVSHIVFGLFFALTITCTIRGLILWAEAWMASRAEAAETRGIQEGSASTVPST